MRKCFQLTETEAIVVRFHIENEIHNLESKIVSGVTDYSHLYNHRIELLNSIIAKLK